MNMISSLEEKNFLIFNPDTIWNSKYLDCIKQMEIFYQNNKVKNVLLVVNKQLSFDQTLKGDFKLDINKLNKNTNNKYIYTGCQIFSKDLLNSKSRITAHKNYRKGLMPIRCYLSLYNTHHPAEKLGLTVKSLNLMQSLNQ